MESNANAANAKSGGKGGQVRLVEAVGDELAALLAPMSPQTFVNEHWGKKPLFVKGFAEKFKGFFDSAAFFRAASTPQTGGGSPATSAHLRASFDKKTAPPARGGGVAGEPVHTTQSFPITPEQMGALHEAGATLCMTEIDTRIPRLAYFAAAIKRQLGHPGLVAFNAYLSAPGAGLNWHFDGRIASTLQIEGSKRWRFSKRVALEWPRGNGVTMSDGSARYDANVARAPWEQLAPLDKGAVTEVVLEPGDFLCLPAGTWHDASGGATGSLALNLAFNPIPYTHVVGELLDALLASDPGWRCARPLLPKAGGLPGEVDPRALEAIGKQLQNAADALRGIAADSAALTTLWSSLVQSGPSVDPPAAATGPITPSDRFRVRADGNVYVRLVENGARLSVGVGTRARFEVTGDAMRVVQQALTTRKFEGTDCAGWGEGEAKLAWTTVEEILAQLLREGVIERVTGERAMK
jgi:ribosomal protein L16 Arg81 hydroxylase